MSQINASTEDLWACAQLANAFAYHVDRNDVEGVVALFAEDGEFKRPGLHVRGHEEIRAWIAGRGESPITRHVTTAPLVKSTGPDSATGISYFSMFHAEKPAEGVPVLEGPSAIAEYHDEYRRTAQGWRIARRKVFVAMVAAKD